MNSDEIIRMAREAGYGDALSMLHSSALERFATLVAAAERQRLHDKFMQIHQSQQHSNNYWHFAARKIKEEA